MTHFVENSRLLAVIFTLLAICNNVSCMEKNNNECKLESFLGDWICTHVYKKDKHSATMDDHKFIGVSMQISTNNFTTTLNTGDEKIIIRSPVYALKIVKYYHDEDEVPDNEQKRTSIFYGYRPERNTVCILSVHDTNLKSYGNYEYIPEKDEIVKTDFSKDYIIVFKKVIPKRIEQ